jgi:para-aminobenzoate synthetase component 1
MPTRCSAAAGSVPILVDDATVPTSGEAYALLGGRLATRLDVVTDDVAALDEPGFWVVVGTFEGQWTCMRFAQVDAASAEPWASTSWPGVAPDAWASSLGAGEYQAGVATVRSLVAAGEVYQVNLCRVLRAPLPEHVDLDGLAARLWQGNPAPFAARIRVPEAGVDVVSASPELYLRRDGRDVSSSPIKGTGRVPTDIAAKDVAENVMIVDLVRNDLGRVCEPGSVGVDDMLAVQAHPGLVHLVSTVRGRLRRNCGWPELVEASFPPGSVSGAPKSTALRAISSLEPVVRGPYCGAIGWVDGANARGELAVGIRTFWREGGHLHFGTGAGITWGSDAVREWEETELKARRLLGLAQR